MSPQSDDLKGVADRCERVPKFVCEGPQELIIPAVCGSYSGVSAGQKAGFGSDSILTSLEVRALGNSSQRYRLSSAD
jgi:hypothetical protein